MKFDNLIDEISKSSLLNWEAHQKLVPEGRKYFNENEVFMKKPKLASVLILLYEENRQIKFPLTVRNEYEGIHSAQISFPGGKKELFENLEQTAKRETFEEIGVEENKIQLIKKISNLYIPVSNFYVHPFIGKLDEIPNYRIDEKEVKELIICSLDDLLNTKIEKHPIKIKNNTIFTPCFKIQNQIIWGATAMILNEFKEIVISL